MPTLLTSFCAMTAGVRLCGPALLAPAQATGYWIRPGLSPSLTFPDPHFEGTNPSDYGPPMNRFNGWPSPLLP